MFVLSEGMPKSGSTLFSYYQREILCATELNNGQDKFEKLISEGIIDGVGHFVHSTGSVDCLEFLAWLSTRIGPFLVKAHSKPDHLMLDFLRRNDIIVTYIHRDPRDVILSVLDHSKRPPKVPGERSQFSEYVSIAAAIPLVKEFCKTAVIWKESGLCHFFNYHELLCQPQTELERFFRQIDKTPDISMVSNLIDQYTLNQIKGKRQFNTGKLTRFNDEMTQAEKDMCQGYLFNELTALNYL